VARLVSIGDHYDDFHLQTGDIPINCMATSPVCYMLSSVLVRVSIGLIGLVGLGLGSVLGRHLI